MLKNKKIAIIGGSGFLAQGIIKALENYNPAELRLTSRTASERAPFSHSATWIYADVLNPDSLCVALKNIDTVILTAALKAVPECEANPAAAININVIGAKNVVEACAELSVKQIIYTSTDMAVEPQGVYGASKMLATKIITDAASRYGIQSCSLREGNILGAESSGIAAFFEKAALSGEIPVTDSRMTRFASSRCFYSDYIVSLINRENLCGEVFVPKIKSYDILTMAKAVAPGVATRIVGLRPGEQLAATMISRAEAYLTVENKKEYIVLPSNSSVEEYCSKNNTKRVSSEFYFSSDNTSLRYSVEELKSIIESR